MEMILKCDNYESRKKNSGNGIVINGTKQRKKKTIEIALSCQV